MGNRFITAFFLVLVSLTGYGQTSMDKGDKAYNKKDYQEAIKNYLVVIQSQPDNPELNFKLGMSYLYTLTKSKAAPYLEKAYKLKPEVDPDIDYHLGMAYQNNHQFGLARKHFEEFKRKNKKLADIVNEKLQQCIIGDSLVKRPVPVTITNFGPTVNSNFHDYSPIISADGNTLIFTSNRSTDEYKIKSSTNFEDIYICHRTGSDWSAPEKISSSINIKYNDAAASLSPDGKTLYLYYESGAGDIYSSTLNDNGKWSKPEALKGVNMPTFWETSACVSVDGKKLFFSSNRPGGRGELDIWMCTLDAKGNWGKPANLGKRINTAGNEDSPYIHPDGVTLYFSSDGHPSLGGTDIFKSVYKDGQWSRPVNLGYPINSIEYDGFFTMSADKKTGYFSAMRVDGFGEADLYKIEFKDEPKPKVIEDEPVILASNEPINIPSPTLPEPATQQPAVTEQPKPVVEQPKVEQPKTTEKPKEEPPKPVEQPKVEQPVVTEAPKTEPPVETPVVVAEAPPQPEPETTTPAPAAVPSNKAGTRNTQNEEPMQQYVDPIVQKSKDNNVVTVLKGKVIDENTAAPLAAVITLVDNTTNKIITRMNSNPATGNFELVIPHGGNYGVSTDKDGYLFNSINFNLPAFAEYQEIDTHIIMVRAEVGSKAVLKNVFFDVGKSELKQESVAELELIKLMLIDNSALKVQINGHTDNTGNAETNKSLSLKRAQAVVDYLIQKGIDASRLSAKGFGSERPLVSNDDEQEGREINRRTEIEVLAVLKQQG